jgi:hypothetical protein
MPPPECDKRILFNDDGWVIPTAEPPLSSDYIYENMIATYEGSPVDTLLWSVGGHEVFCYETQVGEIFGEGFNNLTDERERNAAENLRGLIENHGGPITLLAKLCRAAGMKFFPSLRMNEHYNMEVDSASYGRLRRERPELLIGRVGEQIPADTLLHGIRTGLDYTHPDVRAFMTGIIFELIERFDIDGIELDFMRHPAFFRSEEAYANRYLVTDLIQRVRDRISKIASSTGRQIELAVRTPPTLADSARIGLDAESWVKEGLVDLVIAGGGFIPFETPIAEFVDAAAGTKCKILGCFEALRPNLDEEVLRAIAARYWDAGASGLYFFNYFTLPNEWKRNVLTDLSNLQRLSQLTKWYESDRSRREGSGSSQIGHTFDNAIPLTQLPVTLERTYSQPSAAILIDVVESETPDACKLRLRIDRLEGNGELIVTFNQTELSWMDAKRSTDTWSQLQYAPGSSGHPSTTSPHVVPGEVLEFEVPPAILRRGKNVIEVRFDGNTDPAPILDSVRLAIEYN